MTLTKQEISEFKKLYKQKFGVELTDELAGEYGLKLVALMKILTTNNS